MTDLSDRQHFIIGTAGHIDHGKTALVKALTGIDADSLAEEKRRGITIELGFVFLDLPDSPRQVVIIDVPGHEKLLRTMVAGAGNLDAALLLVAADEGVAPQTLEHLDVLRLLDVPQGLIVISKCDLVEPDKIKQRIAEARELACGTFLEKARVITVSALSGQGLAELRTAVADLAAAEQSRYDNGIFRMPVDRAFSMPGFGSVVAGTVLSGRVSVGDRVEVFPDCLTARVRKIQVHGRDRQVSQIGRRTAVNLQDVSRQTLRRGQCLAAPGSLKPVLRLDAGLRLLPDKAKLKNRDRLRLHIGTDEIIGRVLLLDRDELVAGQEAPVQFLLESPTVAVARQPYVVRSFSPPRVIGGGRILDADPSRHKRLSAETAAAMSLLMGGAEEMLEQAALKAGLRPQSLADLAAAAGLSPADAEEGLRSLQADGKLLSLHRLRQAAQAELASDSFVHARAGKELRTCIENIMADYLRRHRYRLMMPLSELRSRCATADKGLLEAVFEDLCRSGALLRRGPRIGPAGYRLSLTPSESKLAESLKELLRAAGLTPPSEEELRQKTGAEPSVLSGVLEALQEQGALVRLSPKVIYDGEALAGVQRQIMDRLKDGGISVAELRDSLGISRKYALALLEHFDEVGLTRREGDRHVKN